MEAFGSGVFIKNAPQWSIAVSSSVCDFMPQTTDLLIGSNQTALYDSLPTIAKESGPNPIVHCLFHLCFILSSFELILLF